MVLKVPQKQENGNFPVWNVKDHMILHTMFY